MPAFGAFVGTNRSGEDDARLNECALQGVKGFLANVGFLSDALNGSSRVSQDDESDVIVASGSLDPTFQLNLLAIVLALLHIAYPCGLDHALTIVSHPPCLCECLPHRTSEVRGSAIVS